MSQYRTFGAEGGKVTTPSWVRHAVFYQIFPDRFAKSVHIAKPGGLETWDSDPTTYGYKGGDLLGVVDHLDELQDLGITALYFNPIFQSASNHTGEHRESWNLPGGRSATGQVVVTVGDPPTVAASTITVPGRSGAILRLKDAR